ncbi:hypothetical protein [Halocatena pleomorpha]|uniref:Uncharacterized protein n=1 Tax=Halocatena pleomorpha TaxID=1785090 RepID=A0A3P3RDZ8_9EURY|nr:hypothetical protein [Halocatena pleomorpha]RRJ31159.1 hypothetical protein EIK79_07960 [Halocatena pleomorpha]
MGQTALLSPPLLAVISGVAWAVIADIGYRFGQTEPLQRYYAGRLVAVLIGSIPPYLINRAGLSLWFSLIGLLGSPVVWILCKRQLSPDTNSLTIH